MQPLGSHDVRFDQRMQRAQRKGARAHLIGQRRHAEVYSFPTKALALSVQRLVLAEFLEQDQREKVGAQEAARRRMEGRRRLRNLLARAAGEPLPHRLHHLPLPWNDLQGLGDVLAQSGQVIRSAAGTRRRRRHNHSLTGLMFRKGLAPILATHERRCAPGGGGSLGGKCVLVGGRLGLLKLHFELLEKPRLAFRACAVKFAPELLDFKLQARDQRQGL